MTNFEKYWNEILEIVKDNETVAVCRINNRPISCDDLCCDDCLFQPDFEGCKEAGMIWLRQEAVEKTPTLTVKERGLCEAVKSGFIARDKDEILCIYKTEPFQSDLGWSLGVVGYWIEIDENLFQFITWESNKAWSIEDLLKLEVEE